MFNASFLKMEKKKFCWKKVHSPQRVKVSKIVFYFILFLGGGHSSCRETGGWRRATKGSRHPFPINMINMEQVGAFQCYDRCARVSSLVSIIITIVLFIDCWMFQLVVCFSALCIQHNIDYILEKCVYVQGRVWILSFTASHSHNF